MIAVGDRMTEKKTDVLNLRLDACVSTEIDHTKRPVTRQVTSSTATTSLTVTRTRAVLTCEGTHEVYTLVVGETLTRAAPTPPSGTT